MPFPSPPGRIIPMKPWQFSIRWLLQVTLLAGVYAVFVRGALYSPPQWRECWQVLLLGLTLRIAIGIFVSASQGKLFEDGTRPETTP